LVVASPRLPLWEIKALRYSTDCLDYLTLTKAAGDCAAPGDARTVKIAVLADCAVQQLTTLLKVLAARNRVALEVYEGGYDSIDLEILNPDSGLYAFGPQFVIVLMSSEKLKSRLYDSANRTTFAADNVERIVTLWSAFAAQSSATIVQSTFVLPIERAFGNYELKVADSVGAIFTEINYRLAIQAREARNILLSDVDFLAASIGRSQWFDPRLWNIAKVPCRLDHLPRLAQSLLDTILAATGVVLSKCVVLDLDNTLWGGVIGDDGLEGIALGEFDEGEAFVGFQKFIRELKRRGIILAVVSKNEHANAIRPFRDHPHMVLKEDDISAFLANWDNKADNIRLVQKTLNIGFDSFVFLDDNPFERNLVREYLPNVIIPELRDDPSSYLEALADLNLFETTSFSEADMQRSARYREEARREITKTQFTNVNDYLKSLSMQIRLERFNSFNLPRIAQLIQRSNQFNLTTRRYGEAACEAMMKDTTFWPLTLKLADKFGDYGLISVVILNPADEELEIDEYLMSCRVLQRGVESFAMNNIFAYAARLGVKRVVGHYIATTKNDMVKDFFKGFGFEKVCETGGGSKWSLAVRHYRPREVFMNEAINELN
jgi:FkbH-like protein